MNQLQRHDFFATLKAHNPAPKTELDFTTPFELLIAVMLSAQATDVSVNKATKKLYPIAKTAETLFDFYPYILILYYRFFMHVC